MRQSLSILFATVSLTLAAQPLIDASSAPAPGMVFDYDIATLLNLQGTGPGQAWNASTAQVNASAQVLFIAPASASASIPNADVVQAEGGSETYYEVGADGLYVVGSYLQSLPITSVYTDPERVMAYPCTLGTAWSDAYAGSYTYQGNTYQQAGTDQFEATGYGTLQLPWGTVDNVLRIDGTGTYTEDGNGNTYVYEADFTVFHKPGVGNFVARAVDGSATLNGAPAGVQQSFVFLQASSIGMDEAAMRGFGVEVFPNPANDAASVVFGAEGDLRLALFDGAGRQVLVQDLGHRAPGVHRAEIALGELPAGLYTLRVSRADGTCGTARVLVTR